MGSWGKAIGLGFIVWFIPFVVAFLVFPLRSSARPVFESVMAVTVAGSAVAVGLAYLRGMPAMGPAQGTALGALWFILCVAIDAPLMLIGGPTRMSVGAYFGDIALTYVSIPVVTWGLGAAYHAGAGRAQGRKAG